MLQYSNEQLATIIGVPIITILLIWTVAIFHKNRKKWNPYDITIVAVLILSILRNIAILVYTGLLISKYDRIPADYLCKSVVWFFNSVHTFQASSLTTLTVIALFTVKLYRKQQNLQQNLTSTHVIYHLFCLTTLCACVGVAAILAQEDGDKSYNSVPFGSGGPQGETSFQNEMMCKFMPFELDIKYNIFIIVLHVFLSMVSLVSFACICFQHLKMQKRGFDYLKKSTSDLSELSLSLTTASPVDVANKSFEGYSIRRGSNMDTSVGFENYDSQGKTIVQNNVYQAGFNHNSREPVWNSDLSNISMTVSSTNSKRPCISKRRHDEEEESVCGLQTMYPTLTVCYLFNHVPLIILCIFPGLIKPWPVSGVALWMGQIQDILIPIGLGLVDSRFCKWVSEVYKCSERRKAIDKIPPGVGLDGKFRHFGSQPQSLEVSQQVERTRGFSCSTEPKFPITNGSLYTSIDGRLPIIHNYRRNNKEHRTCPKTIPSQSVNTTHIQGSHLKRQDYVRPRQDTHFVNQSISTDAQYTAQQNLKSCPKCESAQSSHLNLYQNRGNYNSNVSVNRNDSFANRQLCHAHNLHQPNINPIHKRISLSQDSLCETPIVRRISSNFTKSELRSSQGFNGNQLRMSNRMSKSEDCLNELQKDLQVFKQNPEVFQSSGGPIKASSRNCSRQDISYISSDEEYLTDTTNINETMLEYDGTSQSSYSITTEANGDFDFYQNSYADSTDSIIKSSDVFKSDKNRVVITVANSDSYEIINNNGNYFNQNNRKSEFTTFKPKLKNNNRNSKTDDFTEAILSRCNARNSIKNSENDIVKNFRITRSNSKRSLENFQAYIEVDYKVQRSNSFVTVENHKKRDSSMDFIEKFDYRLANNSSNKLNLTGNGDKGFHLNNKSVTYINENSYKPPPSIYGGDVKNFRSQFENKNKLLQHGGSVPDFKKVFISEYI